VLKTSCADDLVRLVLKCSKGHGNAAFSLLYCLPVEFLEVIERLQPIRNPLKETFEVVFRNFPQHRGMFGPNRLQADVSAFKGKKRGSGICAQRGNSVGRGRLKYCLASLSLHPGDGFVISSKESC